MKLEQTKYDNAETGCCARLDPALWEEREVVWKDKPFLTEHVRSFFHVPLDFGKVMTRSHAAVQGAEAFPEQPLWLTDEASPWRSDLYVAVDRDVPAAEMQPLSGRFLTKVFEGPYRAAGKWAIEMQAYAAAKGERVDKLYFYWPYCPKCAKRFGKNHAVLFARVGEA